MRITRLLFACALVWSSACGDDERAEAPSRARDAAIDAAIEVPPETRPARPEPPAKPRDAGKDAARGQPEPESEPEPKPPASVGDAAAPPPSDAGAAAPRPAPDAGVDVDVDVDAAPQAKDASAPDDDAGAEPRDSDPDPDPEVAALLTWVLDQINTRVPPSSDEIQRIFSPEFLLAVPEPMLLETFVQLAATLPPITVIEQTFDGLSATARIATADGRGSPWIAVLVATGSTPRKILQVELAPAIDVNPARTYDEVIASLEPLAERRQLLVSRVSPEGSCAPIAESAGAEPLAIGSAFKLWVLLALDEKLAADPTLSWQDTLPIRDALKSLPSGELQNRPAGMQVTLDEYASKMIEISDNTATDHLIDYVGRTAVEEAQLTAAHGNPAANIPWLTTRELFVMKLILPDADLDRYQAASVPERRMFLDEIASVPVAVADAAGWTTPRRLDLEWFATPTDLCNVLARLALRARYEPDARLLQILGRNSGMSFDPERWQYAGFKGGSEPGVLNLSWIMQRADGAWFSVIVTLNDMAHGIDAREAVAAANAAVRILAEEP